MRMEERLRLLALAERHDAWIVEDDYDSEYRFRGRPIPAMQGLDRSGRVIYLGTFAKTLFPSLRLGFVVVPPRAGRGLQARGQRHRPFRAAAAPGGAGRLHPRRLFLDPSQAHAPALCAATAALPRAVPPASRPLDAGRRDRGRDAGDGPAAALASTIEAVAAAALRAGHRRAAALQPVPSRPARAGPACSAIAGVAERETLAGIRALQEAFVEVAREPQSGSAEKPGSGPSARSKGFVGIALGTS